MWSARGSRTGSRPGRVALPVIAPLFPRGEVRVLSIYGNRPRWEKKAGNRAVPERYRRLSSHLQSNVTTRPETGQLRTPFTIFSAVAVPPNDAGKGMLTRV